MGSLVSVIIPSYKRPTGLKNAIKSILNQTYKNIEIIVVDDNNPNSKFRTETESVMKSFEKFPNVKYIKHSKNKNGSAARNTGIRHALGEYVAFLDNDDEFLENKIKLQVKKLKELGNSYGIVYTKFIRKNKGKVFDRGIEDRTGYLTTEILKGAFFISAGSNILVRREIIDKIEGFDEKLKRRQDLDFLARASLLTKIAHVDQVCLIIHKDDRSNANALSIDESKKVNQKYLSKFNNYISKLSQEEQESLFTYHSLQYIRLYLFRGKVTKAFTIYKEDKILVSTLIRYFFYLFKRKLFKQCYGFRY